MPDSERHRESHEDLCPSEKGVGLERWSLLKRTYCFCRRSEFWVFRNPSLCLTAVCSSNSRRPNTFGPSGHLRSHAHSLISTTFKIIKKFQHLKKLWQFQGQSRVTEQAFERAELFFSCITFPPTHTVSC